MTSSSLAAFGLCFAGMAVLGLAMDRHHRQATGRPAPSAALRQALRCLGCCLLALSLRPVVLAAGWPVGSVLWCGWLTAGALAVACMLCYAPRRLAGAAALSGMAAWWALLAS